MHRLPSSGAGCAHGHIAHLSHMNASVDVIQNAAEIVHVAVLSIHIASGVSTGVSQLENPSKLSACLYHGPATPAYSKSPMNLLRASRAIIWLLDSVRFLHPPSPLAHK